jgi:chondroitin AC lyase
MKEPVVEKELFTLWIDHGIRPQKGSYEYVVLPGINATSLESYFRTSPIAILSNTSEIQAVLHKGLNLAEIVFYQPGSLKIADGLEVTAESPCIIMLKMSGNHISEIAVSDPTQKLKSLQFSINTLIEVKGDYWQIEQNKEKGNSIVTVDLPQDGYAGQSVVIKSPH